jgi:hypothetical protein
MTLSAQAGVVIAITAVLYIGALGVFGRKLGPLLTGVLLLAISCIPLLWQHFFTQSKAHGLGFVLFSMALLPGLLIFWGATTAIFRKVGRGKDDTE